MKASDLDAFVRDTLSVLAFLGVVLAVLLDDMREKYRAARRECGFASADEEG